MRSNGFHPLYRALVDHAPADLSLCAWDNARLQDRLSRDVALRATLLRESSAAELMTRETAPGSVGREYLEYFWAPERVLTRLLPGDIEFHHTTPFPSMKRPFILHCESFAPVMQPFMAQGAGRLDRVEEVREFYRGMLAHPLCLGVFSHVPETLESFRRFFRDPEIDRKLRYSRVGISAPGPGLAEPGRRFAAGPVFLFLNSAHQNAEGFRLRGGAAVLRFWKRHRQAGGGGTLILRCRRPDEDSLRLLGIDVGFVAAESGRGMLWVENYLPEREISSVLTQVDFFLLPSYSLHSVSIIRAMASGAIPVVSDAIGVDRYIKDGRNGIVLRGMRRAIWTDDPVMGIPVDDYGAAPRLDDSMAEQMLDMISSLLASPERMRELRTHAISDAQHEFSGVEFARQFWTDVRTLGVVPAADPVDPVTVLGESLADCRLSGNGWKRVFCSPPQPLQRANLGDRIVSELGGVMVLEHGTTPMRLHDWSILAQHWRLDAPRLTMAERIEDLDGEFLDLAGRGRDRSFRRLTRFVGRVLTPFPQLHSFASGALKRARRQGRLAGRLALRIRSAFERRVASRATETRIVLVLAGYHGYNIVRLHGRYHAILQADGAFSEDRLRAGGYRRPVSGTTLSEVKAGILATIDRTATAELASKDRDAVR